MVRFERGRGLKGPYKFQITMLSGFVFSLVGCGLAPTPALPSDQKPAGWAREVHMEGVPNLHQVDVGLYRGGQPTDEGWRNLEKAGIRTVVCLRRWIQDGQTRTSLPIEHIPMNPLSVHDEQFARFLEIAGDPSRQPVYVYCWLGSDRTSALCAAYRVVIQGWSKEEALREMTNGGFGYRPIYDDIRRYLLDLDVTAMRNHANHHAPVAASPR